jgi:hypothetical protein
VINWDYLLDRWTTEQILEVNEGNVPEESQLEEIVAKLEEADLWKMPVEKPTNALP